MLSLLWQTCAQAVQTMVDACVYVWVVMPSRQIFVGCVWVKSVFVNHLYGIYKTTTTQIFLNSLS